MDISIRRLVEVLGINSPIYFTEKDKLNKENYCYFQPIGEAEKEAIRNRNHNLHYQYDPVGMGVYLPDITACEYLELESARNPIAVEFIICRISQEMIVYLAEYPILLATFCVLHEHAHWVHFMNSGKSPYEYALMETNERKPYAETEREIHAMDDWNPLKMIQARKFHKNIYSQFTSEKFANEYAMKNFSDALEKVRASIGYSEMDLIETIIQE